MYRASSNASHGAANNGSSGLAYSPIRTTNKNPYLQHQNANLQTQNSGYLPPIHSKNPQPLTQTHTNSSSTSARSTQSSLASGRIQAQQDNVNGSSYAAFQATRQQQQQQQQGNNSQLLPSYAQSQSKPQRGRAPTNSTSRHTQVQHGLDIKSLGGSSNNNALPIPYGYAADAPTMMANTTRTLKKSSGKSLTDINDGASVSSDSNRQPKNRNKMMNSLSEATLTQIQPPSSSLSSSSSVVASASTASLPAMQTKKPKHGNPQQQPQQQHAIYSENSPSTHSTGSLQARYANNYNNSNVNNNTHNLNTNNSVSSLMKDASQQRQQTIHASNNSHNNSVNTSKLKPLQAASAVDEDTQASHIGSDGLNRQSLINIVKESLTQSVNMNMNSSYNSGNSARTKEDDRINANPSNNSSSNHMSNDALDRQAAAQQHHNVGSSSSTYHAKAEELKLVQRSLIEKLQSALNDKVEAAHANNYTNNQANSIHDHNSILDDDVTTVNATNTVKGNSGNSHTANASDNNVGVKATPRTGSLLPPPLPLPLSGNSSLNNQPNKLSARDAGAHTVVGILNSARRSINANIMSETSGANANISNNNVVNSGKGTDNDSANVNGNGSNNHGNNSNNNTIKQRRKSKESAGANTAMDATATATAATVNNNNHTNNTTMNSASNGSNHLTHQHLSLPPVQTGSSSSSNHAVLAHNSQGRVISPTSSRVLRPCKYDQLVAQGTGPSHVAIVEELKQHLIPHEYNEIKEFPGTLYYLGLRGAKLTPRTQPISKHGASNNNNHGTGVFDDDHGTYIATNRGDHIAYRYAIKHELGAGSFGSVLCCRDHKHNVDVAIKVIKSLHKFTVQAQTELKILSILNKDDVARERAHMIKLLGSFTFRNHVCLAFPLYGLNLYDYLKANNFKGVSHKFVRKLAYQLFEHLDYLRAKGIVHLDLKPENILLQDEATVKIVVIDFGSSCMSNQNPFTYVQSRFYRSPEVLLGCPYGHEVDMWSVACILPEMRSSMPIFPGRDEVDQLGCIVECLGMPPAEMVEKGGRKHRFFDARDRLLKGKQKSSNANAASHANSNANGNANNGPEISSRIPGSKSIAQLSKAKNTADDIHLMSLLAACFKWSPSERLTPQQALQHPWFHPNSQAP